MKDRNFSENQNLKNQEILKLKDFEVIILDVINSILKEENSVNKVSILEDKILIEILNNMNSSSFINLVFDFNFHNPNYFFKTKNFICYYTFDKAKKLSSIQTEFLNNLKNGLELKPLDKNLIISNKNENIKEVIEKNVKDNSIKTIHNFKKNNNSQNPGIIDIYSVCDLKCIFCNPCHNIDLNSKENFKRYISQIETLNSPIIIGGAGEPLLYPYFEQIIEKINNENKEVIIHSTGQDIESKKDMILKYKKIITFSLPIYGSIKKIYENITLTPGSYKKIISSIKILKENNIKLRLRTVLLKQNYKDIKNIIELSMKFTNSIFVIDFLQPDPSVDNFAENSIMFKDAVPYLKKITNQVNMCSVPECFLFNNNLKFNSSNFDNNTNRPKFKLESCKLCKVNLRCAGIYKKYTESYGTSEIVPILQK